MSTYESAYKSMLQGVSQQRAPERLPGQLTAQVNMMSDPVTNIRRRPGVLYRKDWEWDGAEDTNVLAWFTDIAGARVHIILNTLTGNLRVLNEAYVEEASLEGGAYLTNADPSRIRAASCGSEFFICNTDVKPVLVTGPLGPDPANSGFFYIVSGAFSKAYNAQLVHSGGSISATYTTPSGAAPGDAALATPEYIAEQLLQGLSTITTFDRVRLLSYTNNDLPAGGVHVTPVLQYNSGTSAAPVWTAVTFPMEMSTADIANGFLRIYGSVIRDAPYATIGFNVRVNTTWVAENYVSDHIYIPLAKHAGPFAWPPVPLQVNVPVFTGQASVIADPTLYIVREGPYVFLSRTGGVAINTTVGTAYMVASKGGAVASAGNLPARLPPAADRFEVQVGTGESPQYYRYVHKSTEWIEVAKYGSPTAIQDCPVSLYYDGSAWALGSDAFEGKTSGNDTANPAHKFMSEGITGIGTHQGRLVLMSGPLVSMSASQHPRRFFRTTMTSLLASDPIEIGSSMNSSAAYEWAIPFQKDLILFSRAYQAVIPNNNTAVTPSNANVVPTSAHEGDTTCSPVSIGRTLMYCNPRSEDFFGVLEMMPSNSTESQYVSQDSTPHLPKYMPGRCRFAVSSGVASMALFAPTGDPNSLIVHEYHWDGDTKVQQAWHQWTFEYPIATAYFASDVIVLAFVKNGRIVLGTIDPRAGVSNQVGDRRPFLDLHTSAVIAAHVLPVPAWLMAFDPDVAGKLVAVALTGGLAGDAVGASVGDTAGTLDTVLSYPSGTVGLGIPYYSGLIPTPPTVRDFNKEVVHSGKATLLRFLIGVADSSEFNIGVTDAYSASDDVDAPTLSWASPDLELGHGLYSDAARVVVPCRTDLRTTAMEMWTDGTGELNITDLEYVVKHHPKIQRR